jgi:AraC-like DNA-binding protein
LAPFRGALDVHRVGAVVVADIALSSSLMTRNGHRFSDGDDAIVVQLWRQGSAGTWQGKQENNIGARDGLIIDNTRPARISTEGQSRFWALTIPRADILVRRPDIVDRGGMKMHDGAACRLLFGYLGEIVAGECDDPETARLFGGHILDLAALAVGGRSGAAAEEASGVRAARCAAILREIERHSLDPGLTASAVAALLDITPRYVHLLLEETGRSFTAHVLERRLERTIALLRDPQRRHCRIAEIANEAGFGDLSYFNRAFRRRYGATPSDIRNAGRDG